MLPPMLPSLPPPPLLPTTAATAGCAAAALCLRLARRARSSGNRTLANVMMIRGAGLPGFPCSLSVTSTPNCLFRSARHVRARPSAPPPRQNSPHACLSLTGARSWGQRWTTMSAPYLPRRGTSPGQAAPQTVSSCRQRSGCSSRTSPSTSATPMGKSVRRSRQA